MIEPSEEAEITAIYEDDSLYVIAQHAPVLIEIAKEDIVNTVRMRLGALPKLCWLNCEPW